MKLLNEIAKTSYAKYRKIENPAYVEFAKIRDSAYARYEKRLKEIDQM